MTGAALQDIADYLDGYLRIRELPDEAGAVNGLQVENGGRVHLLVAAVDASQATIDGAVGEVGSDGGGLLLVHHGLLCGGNAPLAGRRYRRGRGLVGADAALYAPQIPLD